MCRMPGPALQCPGPALKGVDATVTVWAGPGVPAAGRRSRAACVAPVVPDAGAPARAKRDASRGADPGLTIKAPRRAGPGVTSPRYGAASRNLRRGVD